MNTSNHHQYSALAKWLHWLVATLILVQYLLIELAERAEHADQIVKQLGIIANHKSVGITILLLALIRLLVRFNNQPPSLPSGMPKWQIAASHTSHVLLYGLLFALPITGWLMSSASAYSVSWFNLVVLPDLIGPDKQVTEVLKLVHLRLADALIILAAVHIIAALKHHLVDKDGVLARMVSKSSVITSALVGITSFMLLGGFFATNDSAKLSSDTPTKSATTIDAINTAQLKSDLPVWQIDYSQSHIEFTVSQAGAPFTGAWQQWTGKLQFDADNLENSIFDVSVDINSVFSSDEERDSTIKSSEFFNVMQFPSAQFLAQDFRITEQGYVANGTLTMKGLSHPTTLLFGITQNEKEISLTGHASLERHLWNIGTGDWADPTWVGSEVTVDVKVVAAVRQ